MSVFISVAQHRMNTRSHFKKLGLGIVLEILRNSLFDFIFLTKIGSSHWPHLSLVQPLISAQLVGGVLVIINQLPIVFLVHKKLQT